MHFLSGTIRRISGDEWGALNDAGHTSRGIESVTLYDNRVRVHHAFTAGKVSSFQATPDEQFAASGVRVGASVGYAHTDIYFYMGTSQTPVDPGLLSKAAANVWLTGWFEEVEPVPDFCPAK